MVAIHGTFIANIGHASVKSMSQLWPVLVEWDGMGGTKRPEIPGHLWSDHWNTSAKSKMCKIIQDHHNKGEDEIKQKQLTASPILYGGIVCVSLSQGPQKPEEVGRDMAMSRLPAYTT